MKLFDILKMSSGGAGLANLVRREAEELVRDRLEQYIKTSQNFVARDEFEAVKMMVENALEQNAHLQEKVSLLEQKIAKNDKKPAK